MNTNRNTSFLQGAKKSTAFVNDGLRNYLLRVYKLMGLGLLVSALTGFLGATDAFRPLLFTTTPNGLTYSFLGIIIAFAPLILVFMFGSAVRNINPAKAQTIFWIFSALMGFSFTTILMGYTGESIFQTFLITAASFGGLCLYGYTTKRDLTSMGAFMYMGLWGLIIASIVNFFMQSSALAYGVSFIGVIIFVCLTAYDSQKIKMMYNESDSNDISEAKAISGALALYLDFINLFLMLIRLNGNRR